MFKISFTLSLWLIASTSFSQLNRGAIQLGGGFNYHSTKTDSPYDSYRSFSIMPRAGYVLNNNHIIGLTLGYSELRDTQPISFTPITGELDVTNSEISIGVYHRYGKSLANNFLLFLQTNIGFGRGKLKMDFDNELFSDAEGDAQAFSVSSGPGLTYFISPKFGIDISVGVIQYRIEDTWGAIGENTFTEFDASFNLSSLSFGLHYYLGGN